MVEATSHTPSPHTPSRPATRGLPPTSPDVRSKRASAKSVIVAAMNYAANQSEPGRPGVAAGGLQQRVPQGMHHRAASERVPNGAPPGYGGASAAARKNIISAFGQGDASHWTGVSAPGIAGFDGSASGVQVSMPIDLTSQSSMVHRMMDREKNDVDPRDVHKLLPETMMASDSLDLHSELIHGRINQVIHDIMDAQVVQDMDIPRQRKIASGGDDESHRFADAQVSQLTRFMASAGLESVDIGGGHGGMSSPECVSPLQSGQKSSMRLSPTPPHLPPRPRSVQGLRSTYSATSPIPGKLPATTPVTGYPAAPALGIVHPLNTGRISPAAPSRAQSPSLIRRATVPCGNPVAYPDRSGSQQCSRFGAMNQGNQVTAMSKLPNQHMPYTDAPMGMYPNIDRRTSSRMSCRSPIAESIYESPHGDEIPPRVFAMSPDMRGPLTPIPGQMGDVGDLLNSELDPTSPEDAKGKAARKFRSLEAALAWCHVQHSQKHVPVVPKDDVKKLVEFQLKNGKPIRAPWYRPTRSEDGEDEDGEEPDGSASEESVSVSIPQEPTETATEKTPVAASIQIIPETEALAENHQAPLTEHEVRRASKIMAMHQPQRPERPRCESAPLVRSWKQAPRNADPNRRPTSQSGNVKPLGTGFFCPPGFELPTASPTAH